LSKLGDKAEKKIVEISEILKAYRFDINTLRSNYQHDAISHLESFHSKPDIAARITDSSKCYPGVKSLFSCQSFRSNKTGNIGQTDFFAK
jgi:hypothetical protein